MKIQKSGQNVSFFARTSFLVLKCFDSRCQSFTAQWCISLREALLDARRDTVTHRATIKCYIYFEFVPRNL